MQVGERLARLVADHPRLELFDVPQTGIVLWRPRDHDPLAVQARLTGAFVSVAEFDGRRWLRSVPANPNADPDLVLERVLAASDRAPHGGAAH